MTQYSPSQILTIIQQAGVTSKNAILAMITGGVLESNLNSGAEGGGAYGVWQLQGNPQGADTQYAAQVMAPRYEAAANAIPESLWESDPVEAAEEAAYNAERPAVTYFQSQGTARVTQAYNEAASAISSDSSGNGGLISDVGGIVSDIGSVPGSILGAAGSAPGDVASAVGGVASSATSGVASAVGSEISSLWGSVEKPFESIAVRTGLVIFGAIAVLVGISVMLRSGGNETQSQSQPSPAPQSQSRPSPAPQSQSRPSPAPQSQSQSSPKPTLKAATTDDVADVAAV